MLVILEAVKAESYNAVECKCFANFLCLYALPILPLIPMYANPIHIKIFPYQNTQYDLSFYDE